MTAIITRVTADNSPVVFIADSLKDGQIKAWTGGANLRTVGVDYYQKTQPLSEADSEHLRKRYAKATGQELENVFVRQRLPRVYKTRPDILTNGKPDTDAENKRSAAAKLQVEKDIAAANAASGMPPAPAPAQEPAQAPAAPVPPTVPPEFLQQMEDPRFAALVLKLAEILKPAL